jgi:hypothetical protein
MPPCADMPVPSVDPLAAELSPCPFAMPVAGQKRKTTTKNKKITELWVFIIAPCFVENAAKTYASIIANISENITICQ